MHGTPVQLDINADKFNALERSLLERVAGEVRFDALARAIYATDAGIYEITPRGVVFPKNLQDVVAAVNECREHGTPIIARGAGTGLAGGAVGDGVQFDLSRHMKRICSVDLEARTVEVEPGVVLDELNAHLAPHGLMFAPDVATSSRATIGGMIANNSCGARSVRYGRTVDHVAEVTLVLADGRVATFTDEAAGPTDSTDRTPHDAEQASRAGDHTTAIEGRLADIRDSHYDEIRKRFPKILRSNGGYGLDRLGPPGSRASALKIICGSEGTLGVIVGARLRLVPIPEHVGLLILHFDDLLASLRITPAILKHHPSTVELIDKLILDAGRSSPALARRCDFLQGDPSALLVVEVQADSEADLAEKLNAIGNDTPVKDACRASVTMLDHNEQDDVWRLRTSGLGLLMSKPGDEQPYSFVEDTAVDPERLAEYIERFTSILDREHVHAGYYAHASVGCIHVKPAISLRNKQDVGRMRRIAEAACDLAVEFGGTVSGEHGDGIVRSCWLERMYGPRIMQAFRDVKDLFDPRGIMNPNKIVDPLPMTERLRLGPTYESRSVRTHLDFSAHGGMAGLARMCSGVGQCRQRLVGTMCPSYMATGDEVHTTRARANALRIALSNRDLLDGLSDPHLEEVMDLCLSCKACKTECPTGVDMVRLKTEYLSHKNLERGVAKRARLIADLPDRLATASRFPRLANLIARSGPWRAWMERRYGLDRRVPPPKLATRTFRSWFRRHERHRGNERPAPRGPVVYFVDTWTNYITPQIGIAAVKLLEHAGYDVHCPPTYCCGRPGISQGLLTEAKQLAEFNIRRLVQTAPGNVPIVGTEPSCLLTLLDEYPQLVRAPAARDIAARCFLLDSFLERTLRDHPDALCFEVRPTKRLLVHGHCHQKALVGSHDTMALLRRAYGECVSEIDSGCCGMAGAFGHEVEHYEVACAVGEQRLFPTIRDRGDADIAVTGFSCRQQIEHHTGITPKHVAEHLADALGWHGQAQRRHVQATSTSAQQLSRVRRAIYPP